MTIGAPLGLLALLAVPAIVALHLFRDRLPERRVAALFLFPVAPATARSGRTRTRRWRSPSLWLECVAALVAAAWLAGLTFAGLAPRHVVFVLDDSASMAASGTRDRAVAAVRARAATLSEHDRVTLIASGVAPAVRVGPRAPAAALEPVLAAWRPHQRHHALAPALALARGLAGRRGEIVLIGDRTPAEPADDALVIACGVAHANAAVTGVHRQTGPTGERLVVRVAAYGDVGDRELRVLQGDRQLARAPLSFGPGGGEAQLALPLPAGAADRALTVALADDALPLDDVVCVVPPRARVVGVHDALSGARRDELRLERVFAAQRDWRAEPSADRAQLLLREAPGPVAAGQLEVVIAPSAGEPRGHRSPFVVDRSAPLLAGMELEGIAWQSGGGEVPGQVLVAAGEHVLIAEQGLGAGRRLFVDLDASAGNVVRSPDWPILFANLLDACRAAAPGASASDVQLDDEVVYRCAGAGDVVTATAPDGTTLATSADGRLAFTPTEPGVYTVLAADGQVLDLVAARFVDPQESDLRPATSFERPPLAPPVAAADGPLAPEPTRVWLAALLLLLVLADWWVLSRWGD